MFLEKEIQLKINFRQKLTLTYLVLILLIVFLTALFSWWRLSIAAKNQLDQALVSLAETEADMLLSEDIEANIRIHDGQHDKNGLSMSRIDRLVEIVNEQGQTLAKSRNMGAMNIPVSKDVLRHRIPASFETINNFVNEPLRVVVFPVKKDNHYYFVLVAGSLDDVNQILNAATIIFTTMAIALALAILWAGLIPIDRILKMIKSIVLQAKTIGQENLHQRLSNTHSDDEIGELISTLNEMLQRLEASFEIQRNFTSHASHELKSPLSRMRTDIEVTLRRPRDETAYKEALISCLDEVDTLTRTLNSMLLLAQLDSNIDTLDDEPLYISDLVAEILGQYHLPSDFEIMNLIETDIKILTKKEFALLLIGNVIDNAIKFTLNKKIRLEAATENGVATLKIIDFGSGIPTEEIPLIFNRFYRGKSALNKGIQGSGLGLALVRTLSNLCQCEVKGDNHFLGGSIFTITWVHEND